jgi:hypothetical protein
MRKFVLFLGVLAFICTPAIAGKNAGGALVCHTDNNTIWTSLGADYCGAQYVDPGTCENANTESTIDGNFDAAVVWLLAAFPAGSNPGVAVVFFGIEHNLPFGYFASWSFCGPAGSLEIPDAGWPDDWSTAGNSVAFGSPVVGQQLFMYYWLAAWGTPGNYLGTGINPTGGYAGFVSDDIPGILDEIFLFGRVDWFGPGGNDCPSMPPDEACCFEDGRCEMWLPNECVDLGGIPLGEGSECEPNPCPQPGACCFADGSCIETGEAQCDGDYWLAGEVCDPNPCGDNPCPPAGADEFLETHAVFLFDSPGDGPGLVPVIATGPTTVVRSSPQFETDGHCVIETEIVEMQLTGIYDPDCLDGAQLPVTVELDPAVPSLGSIVSSDDGQGNPAFPDDSQFDVRVLITIEGHGTFPHSIDELGNLLQSGDLWGDPPCVDPEGPYVPPSDDHAHIPCPPEDPPTGCCHLPPEIGNGAIETYRAICDLLGGVYDGDDSICCQVCCFPDGSCQIQTGEEECAAAGGEWRPDLGDSCDPNPCPPVPVEETTWGNIKTNYR